MLGANPFASNGSLMTAPDFPGRLAALRARGGTLVVVDPRRTQDRRGGRRAPLHPARHRRALPLRARARARSPRASSHLGTLRRVTSTGSTRSRGSRATFTPEAVAPVCGIDADDDPPRRARARRRTERAAVYGRIGTCTQEFGTLASWLVDVLNVLTGNLDREGGAMFTHAGDGGATDAGGTPGTGRGVTLRPAARAGCAGCPRSSASCPVAALAEEIETPGDGQIRALITVAGNPVLSTPERRPARPRARVARLHGVRRHLPQRDDAPRRRDPAGAAACSRASHYDLALYALAVRNVANYSPPVVELEPGRDARVGDPAAARRRSSPGQGAQRRGRDALDDFVAREPWCRRR